MRPGWGCLSKRQITRSLIKSVIDLFKIKRNCNDTFFIDKHITYKGFRYDREIDLPRLKPDKVFRASRRNDHESFYPWFHWCSWSRLLDLEDNDIGTTEHNYVRWPTFECLSYFPIVVIRLPACLKCLTV